MTSDQTNAGAKGQDRVPPRKQTDKPDWSNGLRQIYDSVLDEPLPDAFKDLLAKLDDKD